MPRVGFKLTVGDKTVVDGKLDLFTAENWTRQLLTFAGSALSIDIRCHAMSFDKFTEVEVLRGRMPAVSHITKNDLPLCGAATFTPEFTWPTVDITEGNVDIITCEDCRRIWEERYRGKGGGK
jgi:hypothetical protein